MGKRVRAERRKGGRAERLPIPINRDGRKIIIAYSTPLSVFVVKTILLCEFCGSIFCANLRDTFIV
jgi:hypothetical protein